MTRNIHNVKTNLTVLNVISSPNQFLIRNLTLNTETDGKKLILKMISCETGIYLERGGGSTHSQKLQSKNCGIGRCFVNKFHRNKGKSKYRKPL